MLNPVIKGWANYDQYICASTTFSKVDSELWQMLWQMLWYWAKRRHPKKSTTWLKKRYFPDINNETWVFSCMTDDPKTKTGKRFVRLTKARFTLIKRHIKLKAEANPFDPEYETYFEQRLKQQMLSKLFQSKQVGIFITLFPRLKVVTILKLILFYFILIVIDKFILISIYL